MRTNQNGEEEHKTEIKMASHALSPPQNPQKYKKAKENKNKRGLSSPSFPEEFSDVGIRMVDEESDRKHEYHTKERIEDRVQSVRREICIVHLPTLCYPVCGSLSIYKIHHNLSTPKRKHTDNLFGLCHNRVGEWTSIEIGRTVHECRAFWKTFYLRFLRYDSCSVSIYTVVFKSIARI